MKEKVLPPSVSPRPTAMGTREFVVLTASLMALNALAIDIMLPALDNIAEAFGILAKAGHSNNRQQLVIFSYVAGFGLPQLIFGPLSDRYGRRGILLWVLAAYSLIGAACMFAQSFWILLAIRFVQGISAGAIRVIAVSIVRDKFEGRGMARIMSLVMTVFMAVPILAPALGQMILLVAPWQWTFGVLAIFGALIFIWVLLRLDETLAEPRPLSWASAGGAYLQVIKSRITFGYMAASGIIFGSLFAYISASEQIFAEVFDREAGFAFWFALIALTLSAANFTNSRLVERFGMRRLSHGALVGFILLSLILVIVMRLSGERFIWFMPLFAMIFACFGLIGSNFNALAMEPLGKIAGTASAAYGFVTTTVSAAIGYLIASQYDGSVVPVIMGFFWLGLVALALVAITERGRLFSSR